MRTLLALFFTLALTGLLALSAAAQVDTTGGKFFQPLYGSIITPDVPFGAGPNRAGATQTLLMNIYTPVGGPATPRPVLILAHGGGFIDGLGSRYSPEMIELCNRFTRLGYVTASIDYRLVAPFDAFFNPPAANDLVRAKHDMRAAVRFFRQDAATTGTYNIDPNYIFVGGSSAGAFTALNVAFLDTPAELLAVGSTFTDVEGSSGNPGYSSTPRAAVNLCGALGQAGLITAGSIAFASMHGTADATVPYGVGTTPFNRAQVVYGSGALKTQADAVGVPNPLYTFRGAPHVPYSGTSASAVAYMDTTVRFVRDFLRPQLGAAAPLPVTLTSFTAARQGAAAVLSWATASELNCKGYEVQASADGVVFETRGFVPAASPTSTAPRRYRFVADDAPGDAGGGRYYRLRQLDLDGTAHYYGPRWLGAGAAPAGLAAYPSPFGAALTVALPPLPGPARLTLHNAQGRLLLAQALAATEGATRLPLALPASLPAGYYVLTLAPASGPPQRVKLLKQ